MTETKAEYYTRTTVRPTNKQCPSCAQYFGREVRDGAYLLVGNVLMTRFWGECAKCGQELIWNRTDRYMGRITARAKIR